jgi:hypothetical protein
MKEMDNKKTISPGTTLIYKYMWDDIEYHNNDYIYVKIRQMTNKEFIESEGCIYSMTKRSGLVKIIM